MKSYSGILGLLTGASVVAIASFAYAADAPNGQVEEVVVTGSRVVSNGDEAPTPVTVVTAEKLMDAKPSNLGDALRQLPQFAADTSTRSAGAGSSVSSANTLNLRQFGANRNLVLFDGNRLAPTTSSGAVDTNLIPEGLIKRIDVVTGGVSAVYGSDAVTGVINFIVDRNFDGVKASAQAGISGYGDDASWKTSVVAGTSLFGGRGHIEFSYEHYRSDGIGSTFDRPDGPAVWTAAGSGTAALPYSLIKNGRSTLFVPAGALISSPGILAGTTFTSNGVPTPFVHGQATGLNGLESGGSGAVYPDTLVTPLTTDQVFARFDYDLTDTIHAHLQGGYDRSANTFRYFPSLQFFDTILSGNPFIPASIQATMTANNIPSLGLSFLGGNVPGGLPYITNSQQTQNMLFNPGIEGKFGDKFSWKLDYTYNRSIQHVDTLNNPNARNIAAALDAVTAPNGQIVCQVSLTASASLFPGCLPFNPFGPSAATAGVADYMLTTTYYTLTNELSDVNASVTGSPFSLWAGPVNVALNGEYRKMSLRNTSNADPRVHPDCTGLRPTSNCTANTAPFSSDVLAPVMASEDVKEVGAELEIPLIKDMLLIKALDLNLAGRYTDYSVSGSVETWKIGSTWEVIDGLRVRGTMSQDIRAPTLYDLFAPVAIATGGFTDIHTNTSGPVQIVTQGNAALTPEVSKTKTIGVVYQPSFLPRSSFALDYYDINIGNAITSVSSTSTVIQGLCESSGGTSPYCTLYVRPGPFSDRTAANRPTEIHNQSLNVARSWTSGVDTEANYAFEPADVVSSVPGTVNLRLLLSYQPELRSITIPGVPYTEAAGISGLSKWRANLGINYVWNDFSATIVERWQSSQRPTDPRTFVDLRRSIPALLYTDVTLSYRFLDSGLEPFLSVNNLFNTQPPIIGGSPQTTGQSYPTPPGFDVVGRYFTMGVRFKMD